MYEIQQQTKTTSTKLIQTFSNEHPSSDWITCLLQINPNTIVSASWSNSSSDNVIVIWSKSKSNPLYEPIQRITQKETGGSIYDLVLINQKKEEEEEEEFASSSCPDDSIIIWRRGKGDKFKIKQKIENVKGVLRILYISRTNELISGSNYYPSLLQIWSPSPSSSSSDFVERQKIETSSKIVSLCQINENDTKSRIEFASGHEYGQIMIWSKQINESNHYSSIRTLQSFNKGWVNDLIFIDYKGFDCLIACSQKENKIKIFKGEEEEEELEHEHVTSLIPMSNGQFASGGGGDKGSLNIWSPSSS